MFRGSLGEQWYPYWPSTGTVSELQQDFPFLTFRRLGAQEGPAAVEVPFAESVERIATKVVPKIAEKIAEAGAPSPPATGEPPSRGWADWVSATQVTAWKSIFGG